MEPKSYKWLAELAWWLDSIFYLGVAVAVVWAGYRLAMVTRLPEVNILSLAILVAMGRALRGGRA